MMMTCSILLGVILASLQPTNRVAELPRDLTSCPRQQAAVTAANVRERALQRHVGGVLNDKLFAEQDTGMSIS